MGEEQKTPMTELQLEHKRVLSLIRTGIENTITSYDISRLTGLSNYRVRQVINELITKHGYVIGASNERKTLGYYIPVNLREEKQAVRNLRVRRVAIHEREQALERNILQKTMQ